MEVQTLHHSWLTHWFMLTWAPAACVIHGTALTPKIDLLRRQATQLLLATIAGGWQHNRNDSHLRKTIMNPYVCMSVCLSVCPSVCLSVCVCISECMCIYIYIYRKEAWGFPERNWSGAGEKFGHVIFTAFYNVLWSSWYMKTHWTTSTRGQHTPGMLSVVETSFVFFKFFILCCFVETSRTACW